MQTHTVADTVGDNEAALPRHTIVRKSKEQGVEDGDAKESLIESGVLNNLSCIPALVKDPLLERAKLPLKLWRHHALIYALQSSLLDQWYWQWQLYHIISYPQHGTTRWKNPKHVLAE